MSVTNPLAMFDVKGKAALITGASGAFGMVAARVLAGAGCRLALAAGSADALAEIAAECRDDVIAIFREAAEQEKGWAEYLFKDGSMIGLNKDILCQYVEYITNQRIGALGFEPIFESRNNPLPWINAWLNSDNVQVAPQEAEISSYLVGAIDSEVDTADFGDFDL